MISIINRLFKKKNNLNFVKSKLQNLDNTTNVSIIFDLINNFSEDSEVRFVGGCLRKILSGEEIDDIDLATNLEPVQVCEILSKNKIQFYESGIEHGTVTAKIKNTKFEITTLRKDLITDGRHAKVLENGEVKFIGNQESRIKEDYLRILRYLRFFLNYSKNNHSENLKKIIRKNIDGISKISSERLLDELKKSFKSKKFLNLNLCVKLQEYFHIPLLLINYE